MLEGPTAEELGAAYMRGDSERVDVIKRHLDRAVVAQNNRDLRGDRHHMVWVRMGVLE